MTTITEDIDLPDGTDPALVRVTLQLWGDGTAVTGYETATGVSIAGVAFADGTPWQIDDVVGNDAIDAPTGTVYRVTRTWPGLRDPLVDYLSVPDVGGPFRVDEILTDPPGAIESSALALVAADVTTLETARPRLVEWREADGWDAWTEVDVSEVAPGDAALTVSGGIGTATDVAADGNDRRLFISDALPSGVADVEVYADFTLGKQVGLALRYQSTGAATGVAVIVWSNIIFAANGSILLGVWEFDGTNAGLVLNQSVTSLPGFVSPILSASGDGSEVTVRTKRSHELVVGNIIVLEDVGAFGQVTVATIVDATTFTFTDATVGSWTGGTWRWVIHAGRRKLAARLVGDRITWKQWFPSEAEPSWADPDRAVSALLPATLEDSGLPPPSDGGVGFLVAHLGQGGGGGAVSVNDFAVRVLD